MKPFLKWAGGKTQLLPILEEKFPHKNIENTIYIEPFVGAGAFWYEATIRVKNPYLTQKVHLLCH